ncbi:MAG: hypothetical protein ACYSU1_04875 [Planctomycetota bacterium]|jgi:hypothetical protein
MKFRPLALLPILLFAACSSQPVRLHQLREAEAGSADRASYGRLEQAVALANEFLSTSDYARGFPAAEARFSLGLNDLLLHMEGEGVEALRIETTGWGDLRTSFGDGVHPNEHGFLTARRTNEEATGEGTSDAAFLQLEVVDMTAVLLRQAATMREIQARGEFDYWLNYDLLGINPESGWMEGNIVDRRAYAVQDGFYQWIDQRGGSMIGAPTPEAEEGEMETPLVLPAVTPPGGGNFPEPDLP